MPLEAVFSQGWMGKVHKYPSFLPISQGWGNAQGCPTLSPRVVALEPVSGGNQTKTETNQSNEHVGLICFPSQTNHL